MAGFTIPAFQNSPNWESSILLQIMVYMMTAEYTLKIPETDRPCIQCWRRCNRYSAWYIHDWSFIFRQGVNLYIEDGATLMGSDNISDYPVCETRIEGETCQYFAALINVSGIDGFTLCGNGTIDGNGLRSWKASGSEEPGIPAAPTKTNSVQGLSICQAVPMLLLPDCTFVIRSSGLITFTNVLMYVTLTAALQAICACQSA